MCPIWLKNKTKEDSGVKVKLLQLRPQERLFQYLQNNIHISVDLSNMPHTNFPEVALSELFPKHWKTQFLIFTQ